ncbi:Ferric-pseudobactin receptor precursor [compost metagenome]
MLDLNASYDVDRNLQLGLNLNNVFDKHYYASILSTTGGNVVGEPRNFAVTARYTF